MCWMINIDLLLLLIIFIHFFAVFRFISFLGGIIVVFLGRVLVVVIVLKDHFEMALDAEL